VDGHHASIELHRDSGVPDADNGSDQRLWEVLFAGVYAAMKPPKQPAKKQPPRKRGSPLSDVDVSKLPQRTNKEWDEYRKRKGMPE
jgi:hypothetical protein